MKIVLNNAIKIKSRYSSLIPLRIQNIPTYTENRSIVKYKKN